MIIIFFYNHHRNVFEADKSRSKAMINSGVSPCVTIWNFIQEAGGPYTVSFLRKDMYNTIHQLQKEENGDGDAEALMAYLLCARTHDTDFS